MWAKRLANKGLQHQELPLFLYSGSLMTSEPDILKSNIYTDIFLRGMSFYCIMMFTTITKVQTGGL